MDCNTPMTRHKYEQLCMSKIPDDVQKECKLNDKVATKGYISVKIQKEMYSLLQAEQSVQDLLEKHIKKHMYYYQSNLTPG